MVIHEWPLADELERCEDCGKLVNPACIELVKVINGEINMCGDCQYERETSPWPV